MKPAGWKDKNGQGRGWNLSGEHKVILRGNDAPQWKGDGASVDAGRMRARARYKNLPLCCECGRPAYDRHHVDGNTLNNEPENVRALCRRCHMATDGRLDRFREMAIRNGEALRCPPKPCVVCSVPSKPLTKGRCKPCLMYFRRKGIERPAEFWGRTYKPRSVVAEERQARQDRPCRHCAARWGDHSQQDKYNCGAALARAGSARKTKAAPRR